MAFRRQCLEEAEGLMPVDLVLQLNTEDRVWQKHKAR
jgi:hypothetical protein